MYFWCCAGLVLFDSLVVWHSHVTCMFVANALYMAFISTLVLHVHMWYLFTCMLAACVHALHACFVH